jgi:CHAT domain-containing protein
MPACSQPQVEEGFMTGLPGICLMSLLLVQNGLQYSGTKLRQHIFHLASLQASQLRSIGEFEEAVTALQKALSVSHPNRSSFSQKIGLVRLAILKWNLGEIAESTQYFDQAWTDFRRVGDKKSETFCANCLDLIALYDQGKDDRTAKFYYRSVERFERAIELGRETGFPDFELKCLRQQGQAYLDMHRPEAYLDCNRRGLDIAIKINHGIEKGRCLNNIGVYYQRQNDFSLAVAYFENALLETRKNNDKPTEAECLSNLGMGYRELGNLTRAHFYLASALELDKKIGDLNAVTMDLDNIGSVYLRSGIDGQKNEDLLAALEAFQECLLLQDVGRTDPYIKITALNNMGIIHNELGDYASARRNLNLAMKIVEREKYVLEKCHILNNVATSYLYEDNVAEAQRYFRASYELGSKRSLESVVMETCLGLGRCYERNQQGPDALLFYGKAIESMESMRSRISSEPFLTGFARNKLSAYHGAIRILAQQYSSRPSEELLDEIFNLVERAKARAFLESLRNARMDSADVASSGLKERQSAISRNISELTRRIIDGKTPSDERPALNSELEREEEEYFRLVTEMKAGKEHDQPGVQRETCGVLEVREKILDSRTVLLEYFLGDAESYLILISAERAELYVFGGREEIERSLRAYLKVISDGSFDREAIDNAGERIGIELIPSEAKDELGKAEALIIVPDGVLHYLPFETLRARGPQGSRYLIETATISYCPSASALCALKENRASRTWKMDLLAIGGTVYEQDAKEEDDSRFIRNDALRKSYSEQGFKFPPLPYSKREVVDIAKLFPKDKIQVLAGEAANEGTIKAIALKDFRLIHFACHGVLDEKYPLRSALVLSAGERQEDDGFLQMREIYGLVMNADLVVLSACQTGKGVLEKAEGPMGLARPFFFAGARSVIASLWPINDKATMAFMLEFYKHLVRGLPIGESLRKAKIKMIKSSWSHPFFWAGFVLQGDPSLTSVN